MVASEPALQLKCFRRQWPSTTPPIISFSGDGMCSLLLRTHFFSSSSLNGAHQMATSPRCAVCFQLVFFLQSRLLIPRVPTNFCIPFLFWIFFEIFNPLQSLHFNSSRSMIVAVRSVFFFSTKNVWAEFCLRIFGSLACWSYKFPPHRFSHLLWISHIRCHFCFLFKSTHSSSALGATGLFSPFFFFWALSAVFSHVKRPKSRNLANSKPVDHDDEFRPKCCIKPPPLVFLTVLLFVCPQKLSDESRTNWHLPIVKQYVLVNHVCPWGEKGTQEPDMFQISHLSFSFAFFVLWLQSLQKSFRKLQKSVKWSSMLFPRRFESPISQLEIVANGLFSRWPSFCLM